MPVRLQIKAPTSLCERCTFGQVMRRTDDRVVTFCKSMNERAPNDVVTCSRWVPMGSPFIDHWSGQLSNIVTVSEVDPRPAPGQVL